MSLTVNLILFNASSHSTVLPAVTESLSDCELTQFLTLKNTGDD